MEGSTLVIVSELQVNTEVVESSKTLEVSGGCTRASCNDSLDESLVRLSGKISLVLILMEQIEVVVDATQVLDDCDTLDSISLLVQFGRPGGEGANTWDDCHQASRDS